MQVDNVSGAVRNNAIRRPKHPALIHGDETLTFAELERRVQQTAGALRERGVAAGDIVAVSMKDTIEQIVVIFALMRLGAVMLPMDIRWAAAECVHVAKHFAAAKLITDSTTHSLAISDTIKIDAHWPSAVAAAGAVTTWTTASDSPIALSLSSGTTGVPKGPMVTHGTYMARVFYQAVTNGTTQDEIYMCITPLFFGGSRNNALMNLIIGATVILYPPPYEIEDLVKEINARAVKSVFVVPTLLRRMLQLPFNGQLMFPNLRCMMSSSSVLHKEEVQLVRQRLTPNITNVYATTEAGVATVLMSDDCERKPGSVGRPAFLSEVEIVDDDHNPVATYQVGHVRYRTLAMPDGFYRNPEETARVFHKGWFYPGDLGRLDDEGFLFIVGRSKDVIIRGGVNIYPADIESTLADHPAVSDVSVVGWPGGEFGEEVAAFVVTSKTVTEEALLEHCRSKLAPYKLPRRIFFSKQLPRNDGGKVMKPRLVEMLPRSPHSEM